MKLPSLMEGPAWVVWALYTVLVIVLMWGAPFGRSVAEGYFDTAEAWWAAETDIYTEGIAGYLYPPQSLYVFTPFTWFPRDVGHALWRVLGLALFAFGLNRVKWGWSERSREMFALTTLLVISSSIGATKTGQSNLHLAGCMLLAAGALSFGRWNQATLWLALGLLMKPLGLVPILLVLVIYRSRMAWRIALLFVGFLALPLLHFDPGYALHQYELSFEKLMRASDPGDKVYADLVGLLRTMGIDLAPTVRTLLALIVAPLTLLLAGCACRHRGSVMGAKLLFAFAAVYLMLFNPRTETNTYVILVPYVALATGVAYLVRRHYGWTAIGALACVLLGSDNYGRAFHEATSPWLKPLIALLFGAVLVRFATRTPSRQNAS